MTLRNALKIFSGMVALSICHAREFIDDRGVSFTWPDDGAQPTVIVNANGALSLFHLGMFRSSKVLA
jgi:hypothetical protein